MPYRLSLLTLSLAGYLMGGPAFAQNDDTDEGSIEILTVSGQRMNGYRYDAAEGASPLKLSLKDTPQAISIVGEQQMEDFALNDVNTLLDTVNGLNVEEVETDRTYYTARGFDVTNFQIDGLGLPVINGNTHGNLDTAFYERVEVIRGANGMMTGIGNPSATINLVRKRPQAVPAVSLNIQYGSWNQTRAELDATGALTDAVNGRFLVAREDGDSYLDRYSQDKTLYYGVLEGNITPDTTLMVGASQQQSKAKGNMWGALTLFYTDGTPTDFDTSTNTAADWSNWDVTDTRTFAELNHAFSADWALSASYMHVNTDEDSLLFYTYQGIDRETGLGLTGYASEYDLNDSQNYASVNVRGQFTAFSRQHDVAFGMNYGDLSYTDQSFYDFHTGLGFPALPRMEDYTGNVALPELTDTDIAYTSDVTQRQRAYYAATSLALTNDLKFIAGGRYNDVTLKGYSYAQDESADESEFIPYAGLVYALTPQVNTYLSYTETFQTQNQRDADFNRIGSVTGEASEVGIKASLFDDNALLTFAYFNIKQANLAVADGEAINPVTGVPETVYKGAEGITSRGLEAELAGELLPGLQASMGLTLFDIKGDQQVAAYTPEKTATLNARYTLPALPALTFGASARWQEAISREQGIIDGAPFFTEQGSYTLVNFMASYAASPKVTVSANLNNVTDEKYLTSLYWAQGYYGAPRNYSVNLRVTL